MTTDIEKLEAAVGLADLALNSGGSIIDSVRDYIRIDPVHLRSLSEAAKSHLAHLKTTDADRLGELFGALYQISGAHDLPAHILDVLTDAAAGKYPEKPLDLLPYTAQPAEQRFDVGMVREALSTAIHALKEASYKVTGGLCPMFDEPRKAAEQALALLDAAPSYEVGPIDQAGYTTMIRTDAEPGVATREDVITDIAIRQAKESAAKSYKGGPLWLLRLIKIAEAAQSKNAGVAKKSQCTVCGKDIPYTTSMGLKQCSAHSGERTGL